MAAATATLPGAGAVWDEVINGQRHGVELLENLRDTLTEYEQTQEKVRSLLLKAGLPLLPSAPIPPIAIPPQPHNGNGHSGEAHAKQQDRPRSKTSARSAPSIEGSKTEFVEACFQDDPDTNPKTINEMWESAGGEGKISASLVYKIKHEMKKTPKRKVAAAVRKAPATQRAGTAVLTADTDIRQTMWELLAERPMTAGEITKTIRDEMLLAPMPKKLEGLVMETLDAMRDEKKILRGEGRRYSVVEGASL